MTLVQLEIRRMPHLSLSLPFQAHEALARKCREFLKNPTTIRQYKSGAKRWG